MSAASPASPTSPARLDEVAAGRTLRRLAAAPQPPWLHGEVGRRMAERLGIVVKAPARVLDWSGPVGGAAEALQAALPQARIAPVAGDAGAAATATPRGWRQWWPKKTAAMPVAEVPDGQADLVWSNMALHFVAEPRTPMQAWRRALAPEGFLMFSTLGPGSLDLLREVYREQGWLPAHAPFVDMHDLGDMLVESGFADPVMDQETVTLTYRSAEALVSELHGLGANLDPARHPGLRTPRWRDRLLGSLAAHAGSDGRLALRFEVVYGHAFRAQDKGPRVGPESAIGLDEMKLMLRKPRGPA